MVVSIFYYLVIEIALFFALELTRNYNSNLSFAKGYFIHGDLLLFILHVKILFYNIVLTKHIFF